MSLTSIIKIIAMLLMQICAMLEGTDIQMQAKAADGKGNPIFIKPTSLKCVVRTKATGSAVKPYTKTDQVKKPTKTIPKE
jgi:hypothetical protein